jgi:hypothetical protein
VSSALKDGELEEIPVESRYGNMENFKEKWFRDFSGVVWRLVSPEPPFMGVFLIVSLPDEPPRQDT